MKNKRFFLLMAMVFLMAAGIAHAEDDGAYGQLNDAWNTGVTFDGSDGQRSGMDTGIDNTSGGAPEVPEPTPVYEPTPEPAPEPVPEPTPVYEPTPEPAPEPAPEPVEEQGPVTGEEVA